MFSIPISKSPPHPRYTILESRFPFCNAISEGRPPLCNTSSEAVRQPFNVRIENDSDRKFSKTKISKVFLEITFLHSSCHPDHHEPKIFFWFFENDKFSIPILKSPPHPRYTILESRFPLCNAISEGRPPLRNTSSEAGRQPFNENFLRHKFQKFS